MNLQNVWLENTGIVPDCFSFVEMLRRGLTGNQPVASLPNAPLYVSIESWYSAYLAAVKRMRLYYHQQWTKRKPDRTS